MISLEICKCSSKSEEGVRSPEEGTLMLTAASAVCGSSDATPEDEAKGGRRGERSRSGQVKRGRGRTRALREQEAMAQEEQELKEESSLIGLLKSELKEHKKYKHYVEYWEFLLFIIGCLSALTTMHIS